jgi:hypothetical protein
LLAVDLFPPTRLAPHGLHGAIWAKLGKQCDLSDAKPFALVAFHAKEGTMFVDSVGPGDILPDMPAFLDRDQYVPVPLEATYQVAWANSPPSLRELVETGRLEGE